MLRAVFRVEQRSALRERSLWAIVAVLTALVAYATFGGSRFVHTERLAMERALTEEAERLGDLRDEALAIANGAEARSGADPTSALHVGRELSPRIAALPQGPLSIVAVGQRDVLPQTIALTTRARLVNAENDDATSPLRQSNGPFDLSFVFVFLLPLIVIAMTFDLLSGERERGTLALVLSQPVTLTTFVLGKALQRAALVVSVVLVLALVAPLFAGASYAAPGALLRVGLYAGLLTLYAAFWLALAVAVNAWGRSSAGNALSLVGVWLALLVVVPGLASVAVDAIHPSPSRVELVNLARAAARDAESQTTALEGNHGKPAAADLAQRSVALQTAFEEQVGPVLSRFREHQAKQQAMVDDLRFLSPAILLHEGLADVAGASVARHQDFSTQVDAFHAELKAFFFQRIEAAAPLTVSDYDAMPRFAYQEPSDGELSRRVGMSLLALALATAALLGLAVKRLGRRGAALI